MLLEIRIVVILGGEGDAGSVLSPELDAVYMGVSSV